MKHMLIIGNDRLFIEDLKWMLRNLNCSIKTAKTSFEAIQMINKKVFDFVLIDLFASEPDGKDVATHVRLKRKNGIPFVIGLSANNIVDDNEFDTLFFDPIPTNDLFEILNCCTRTRPAVVKAERDVLST